MLTLNIGNTLKNISFFKNVVLFDRKVFPDLIGFCCDLKALQKYLLSVILNRLTFGFNLKINQLQSE